MTANHETLNHEALNHEAPNDSIFKIASNLTFACLIAGAIIAVIFYFTKPIADQKAIEMRDDAMKVLVKDATKFEKIEEKEGWFKAKKDGEMLAYIVPTESRGYGGAIKMIVAITPDGKVIDYDISKHNETPGLGDKTNEVKFRKQLNGKDEKHLVVVKDPLKKDAIQAITGATISSKAVVNGIKEAVEYVNEFEGGK